MHFCSFYALFKCLLVKWCIFIEVCRASCTRSKIRGVDSAQLSSNPPSMTCCDQGLHFRYLSLCLFRCRICALVPKFICFHFLPILVASVLRSKCNNGSTGLAFVTPAHDAVKLHEYEIACHKRRSQNAGWIDGAGFFLISSYHPALINYYGEGDWIFSYVIYAIEIIIQRHSPPLYVGYM